jgi:hypothetical protein
LCSHAFSTSALSHCVCALIFSALAFVFLNLIAYLARKPSSLFCLLHRLVNDDCFRSYSPPFLLESHEDIVREQSPDATFCAFWVPGPVALLPDSVENSPKVTKARRDWEFLQGIIERKEESVTAKHLPCPHFDRQNGWGHNFGKEGDLWEGISYDGSRWDCCASHSDQGLLHCWARFFKQDVSIVIGAKTQNWVPDKTTGMPKLLTQMLNEPLKNCSAPAPLAHQHECDHGKAAPNNVMHHVRRVRHRDFAHFMGKKNKPWQKRFGEHRPQRLQWS